MGTSGGSTPRYAFVVVLERMVESKTRPIEISLRRLADS
jgi:hypothetical protein